MSMTSPVQFSFDAVPIIGWV